MFGFKKSQKAKRNFASQTPLKKAKFEEFGLKKANMATLAVTRAIQISKI